MGLRFISSQRQPFPFLERRVIYPNGVLPPPPILLWLHHLRHLGNFRSPPIRLICVRHHDNERHPNTTDKLCCCCFFFTRNTVYVNLLMLLLLLLRYLWWPHWPATEEAIGPRAMRTQTRRGRYCLFGLNTVDVDRQRLRFFQPHQLRFIQG